MVTKAKLNFDYQDGYQLLRGHILSEARNKYPAKSFSGFFLGKTAFTDR